MYEALMAFANVLVFLMFVPANGFPIYLTTTDWRDSAVGKSLFVFTWSFAALVDFTLIFKIWVGEDVWHALITIAVFLGINVGLWWCFFTVWVMKREAKKTKRELIEREMRENEESDQDDSWDGPFDHRPRSEKP